MEKLNEEREIRIQRIISSLNSRLEKLQQTVNDCIPILPSQKTTFGGQNKKGKARC